jgi:uncharacterized membrane protein
VFDALHRVLFAIASFLKLSAPLIVQIKNALSRLRQVPFVGQVAVSFPIPNHLPLLGHAAFNSVALLRLIPIRRLLKITNLCSFLSLYYIAHILVNLRYLMKLLWFNFD